MHCSKAFVRGRMWRPDQWPSLEARDVMRVLEQFATQPDSAAISQALNLDLNQPLRETREDFERFYFQHHMKQVNSNMSRLAELSGLERTHLYRKLKQLGIKIKG